MHLDAADSSFLLLKRKSLRRELSAAPGLRDLRIAVLCGTTANEVVDFLEILLLAAGFRPTFHQGDYNRHYEEAVLTPEALAAFEPDLVWVHTSFVNVRGFPPLSASPAELSAALSAEVERFAEIWRAVRENVGCQVIQNDFELPPTRLLGNLDAVSLGGRTRFVNALNLELCARARDHQGVLIHDLAALSARLGHAAWFDWSRWYAYKILTTADANLAIARSLTAMIRALYGRSRKCLVLDLDNTLWGGVIGDDGVENIRIGRETPEAEAFTAFQEYCLALRERGVLLAVCSKNEEENARKGLLHPDSVLRPEHFAAIKASWGPKHEGIEAIAADLAIGVDSLVFVDDNPAERALVAAQLPGVAVPDVGSDVSLFPAILDAAQYFEPVAISTEDLQRAELYAANKQRASLQGKFASYGEYLDSLQMVAEIGPFRPEHMARIAQLTNKTNQFNLTTRRHTQPEIEAMAADPSRIALYGRLADVFGDNGLVSVVVGRVDHLALHLDLWLMSCRVLKRDLEVAMLDAVAARARAAGLVSLYGHYLKTAKNGMVADHYERLGFQLVSRDRDTESSTWVLSLSGYEPRNRHITIKDPA